MACVNFRQANIEKLFPLGGAFFVVYRKIRILWEQKSGL